MSEQANTTLQNVLTEQDLCELLGMTKEQIGSLRREKHLPFIKLTERSRLYFEQDVIEFFRKQRVVLDRLVTETQSD